MKTAKQYFRAYAHIKQIKVQVKLAQHTEAYNRTLIIPNPIRVARVLVLLFEICMYVMHEYIIQCRHCVLRKNGMA